MAKIILEFDKDTELDDADMAMNAGQMCVAIETIMTDVFRKRIKYGLSDEESKLTKEELIEKMREQCYKILEQYGADRF